MIFFITLFRYFTIVLFFTLHFFSYSQGMQTRERAHCARSVFPFIKKKKKKKKHCAACQGIGIRICYSGQRLSAGTSNVIQRRQNKEGKKK